LSTFSPRRRASKEALGAAVEDSHYLSFVGWVDGWAGGV
jgi:hypothetical protein